MQPGGAARCARASVSPPARRAVPQARRGLSGGAGLQRYCCNPAPGASPTPPRGSWLSPPCRLAQPQRRGLGPHPSGRGKPSPGGGGGKNGAKLGDLGISLLFFAVIPGTTTPSPLSPQRSSSSGLSANAFIRLHDAITRSSQKM